MPDRVSDDGTRTVEKTREIQVAPRFRVRTASFLILPLIPCCDLNLQILTWLLCMCLSNWRRLRAWQEWIGLRRLLQFRKFQWLDLEPWGL